MPDASRALGRNPGLSEIADEFKELDEWRRRRGLSLGEAQRYNALFAQLSDHLACHERGRRADAREFLRVRFHMELVIRTGASEVRAVCQDFGGGGCAIACPAQFHLGDDVWLDGVIVGDSESGKMPLHGRARVAWERLPAADSTSHGYGLRFVMETPAMRDQVDRILYRVLGLFLNDRGTPSAAAV